MNSNSHKYVRDYNNLFEDEEDIDDQTFLKNSKNSSKQNNINYKNDSNYSSSNENNQDYDLQSPSTSSLEGFGKELTFDERMRNIEERTLASTNRSLGLLHDTEHVGNATAEELHRQREKLENTNNQLDDIESTLRFSQKHLNGLRSVFGGLRNYFSGATNSNNDPRKLTNRSTSDIKSSVSSPSSSSSSSNSKLHLNQDEIYKNHPVSRLREDNPGASSYQQTQTESSTSTFNQQLDRNLDEMAGSLSRLKELSLDLNHEIESQNDLIDTITNKTEKVDLKIGKQTKDMHKMLGKK